LEEIEAGLVGGKFKPGGLETDRHRERHAESKAAQASRKAQNRVVARSEGPNVEEVSKDATIRFLFLVARSLGVQKPELLAYSELESFYELGTVARDWVDERTLQRFIAKFIPETEEVEEAKNAMLEDYTDWEEPFRNAFSAMHGTKFKHKEGIERVA
jgi:hypothetical protein